MMIPTFPCGMTVVFALIRGKDMDEWATSRWQCSQLNTLHATLLDKGNRSWKLFVSILRTVESKDPARQHWLAVNGFDYAEFVGANLNKWNFPHDTLERIFDQVQARLKNICLGFLLHLPWLQLFPAASSRQNNDVPLSRSHAHQR